MGLPTDHTDHFVALTRAAAHLTHDDDPDFARRGAALAEIVTVLSDALADRRRHPTDDLLSHFATGEVEGRPLTEEEALAMSILVYLAGLDTVVALLSYAVRHLAGDTELRHGLTAQPDRWPRAIEEFLRYYSIVAVGRVVARDATFAGCPMKAGDRLVLSTPAAGRDPRAFERADEFDPDRIHNRHLAFGAGPHRCAGAHLARLEMRVFLEEWHARIPDYAVAPGAVVTQHAGPLAGLDSLPLVWDTGG
jgi:cytochrome P450